MARRKKGAAPFEVISRHSLRPALNVPVKRGGEAPIAPDTQDEPTHEPKHEQEAREPAQPVNPYLPGSPEASAAQSGSGEPVVSTVNGRLRISLNHVSSLVAVGVLLLLILGAFVLGRSLAPSGEPASAEADVSQVLARADVTLPGAMTREVDGRQMPVFSKGRYYLLLEKLPDTPQNRLLAQDIVKFLDGRGEPAKATTLEVGNENFVLVASLRAFAPPNPSDREALLARLVYLERIRRLGEEFDKQSDGKSRFAPKNPLGQRGPWYQMY